MDRRHFLQLCAQLGISAPFLTLTPGCRSQTQLPQLNGPVLIVGAGAAGLTAASLLHQAGVPVEILEANPYAGGRFKRNADFVDFPLPLGAEWIHVNPSILKEIVNDPSRTIEVDTTKYDPQKAYMLFEGQRISLREAEMSTDSKFIGSSWYDFFADYILPPLNPFIRYQEVVEVIDTSTRNEVTVQTNRGTYSGSNVIVTVPVKILQQDSIQFIPALPSWKRKAIRDVRVWEGCKAFIEFSDSFYPALIGFRIRPETAGQKLYYDAAYGQKTSHHVLGLFAVGSATKPYVDLSEQDRIQFMLQELDELFEGKASKTYKRHLFQNWQKEPTAQGAYVVDHENWRRVQKCGEPVGKRLYFAGDAYTDGSDWSSVHAAARSASRAVQKILTS